MTQHQQHLQKTQRSSFFVDINKDILPRRKTGDWQIVGKNKALYLEPELEYRLLSVVFKYINSRERIILQKNQRNLINVDVERGRAKKLRLVAILQPVLGPAEFAEETVTLSKCRVIASTAKTCPQKLAHPARINDHNVKRNTTLR